MHMHVLYDEFGPPATQFLPHRGHLRKPHCNAKFHCKPITDRLCDAVVNHVLIHQVVLHAVQFPSMPVKLCSFILAYESASVTRVLNVPVISADALPDFMHPTPLFPIKFFSVLSSA